MTVGVQGDLNTGVTQPLLDYLGMNTLLEHQRCVGVPGIVKADGLLSADVGLEGLLAGMITAPALLGAIGFYFKRWRKAAKEVRNRTGKAGGDGRI